MIGAVCYPTMKYHPKLRPCLQQVQIRMCDSHGLENKEYPVGGGPGLNVPVSIGGTTQNLTFDITIDVKYTTARQWHFFDNIGSPLNQQIYQRQMLWSILHCIYPMKR